MMVWFNIINRSLKLQRRTSISRKVWIRILLGVETNRWLIRYKLCFSKTRLTRPLICSQLCMRRSSLWLNSQTIYHLAIIYLRFLLMCKTAAASFNLKTARLTLLVCRARVNTTLWVQSTSAITDSSLQFKTAIYSI